MQLPRDYLRMSGNKGILPHRILIASCVLDTVLGIGITEINKADFLKIRNSPFSGN